MNEPAPSAAPEAERAGEVDRLRRRLRDVERVHNGFLAVLMHDLRTPLSSTMLNLELVQRHAPELPQGAQEDLAYAISGAAALADQVSAAYDICLLEADEVELSRADVELLSLAREAVAALPRTPGSSAVSIEVEDDVSAQCDPAATRRVIARLVQAARAATADEGRVRVRLRASGPSARVEVIDEAQAIPPALREGVFERRGLVEMRRTHRAVSRGVGPIYCRLAILAQGGRIGVCPTDPENPVGNTFWLELPAAGTRAR